MSDVTKLGELLADGAQRDAVHIAVAPVIASETLYPGQHIGFVAGSTELVAPMAEGVRAALGIVDPFLTARVLKGERCWLFLYQQTITSLRHQWTHPAFSATETDDSEKAQSERWMRSFADRIDLSYDETIAAIRDFVITGDSYCFSTSTPDECWTDREEMWRHFEIITGMQVPEGDKDTAPFRCSC